MRKVCLFFVCGLGSLLGATQLQAQPLFPGPALGLSQNLGSNPRQVEIGDINGDDRPDIFAEPGALFIADGARNYLPSEFLGSNVIAFSDLNSDGLDDLIGATFSGIKIRLGTLSGELSVPQFAPLELNRFPLAMEAEDFDGDGGVDIAVVSLNGRIDLFLNEGPSGFKQVPPIEFPDEAFRTSASSDVNGDGIHDLGLVDVSNEPEQIRILLGDASGEFVEAPGSPIQFKVPDRGSVTPSPLGYG